MGHLPWNLLRIIFCNRQNPINTEDRKPNMNFYSAITVPIALLLLSGSIGSASEAGMALLHAPSGLPSMTPAKIYLAAGYTDKGEEATIGDPGQQATVGDPGQQATAGDPGEQATVTDPGQQATVRDPGQQATVDDPGEAATIGDPGESSSF
jgi:hypothetical protein